MYRFIRKILFLLPPETAHYLSMNCMKVMCAAPFIRSWLKKIFTCSPDPGTHLFNLQFPNKVGLGAGFDKNAKYLRELETLGFGFVEIGTVTPRPQSGNDKPRLFRLPKDGALINRMGFNNDGVDVIAARLKKWRRRDGRWQMTGAPFNVYRSQLMKQPVSGNEQAMTSLTLNPKLQTPNFLIGGNIGKNKITPNDDAWKDYEICFRALHPYVDFFVVNVSSPNTPGLRELQEKESLRKILTNLQELNKTFQQQRPILLKIAPDLLFPQIDEVLHLAKEINLDGLVVTNTTISREGLQTPYSTIKTMGAGGLSGRPLKSSSTTIIDYIVKETGGTIPVIGSGGIFNGADAREKLAAGASLIEVWTGFVYEGPFIVKRICKYLHLK